MKPIEKAMDSQNSSANDCSEAANSNTEANSCSNLEVLTTPIEIRIEYDSETSDSISIHDLEGDSKSNLGREASSEKPEKKNSNNADTNNSTIKNSQEDKNTIISKNSKNVSQVTIQTNDGPSKNITNENENIEAGEGNVCDSDTESRLLKEAPMGQSSSNLKSKTKSGDNRLAELYAKDTGPYWYTVKGNIVTPPLITVNLPKMFQSLPIHGAPKRSAELEEFQMKKIRQFVGCDLEDDEFDELANYCSPDHLKTGKELIMQTSMPVTNKLMADSDLGQEVPVEGNLLTTLKRQMNGDRHFEFHKKLKYRGVRLMSLSAQYADVDNTPTNPDPSEPPLEPGKDILYRVRIYRPFPYTSTSDRIVKMRHSVFSCDVVLLGRQSLADLRDRIVCQNDVDMRVDVSASPEDVPVTTAKEIFPSGFLFINNVFYVDGREGCSDLSAAARGWAARRGLGRFPARDLAATALRSLVLKLGHPEVYVHQGSCEHLFTFSEIRLLAPSDPLARSSYPCHLALSQDQAVYCTTCAEFSAKWVVVGCSRVPFDPAFFCDTCFNLYLYKDGDKIGDFKAFTYKGNEINMLKPQASYLGDGCRESELDLCSVQYGA